MASLNSTDTVIKNKMNKQNTLITNYTCFILLELKLVRRYTFNLNGRKLCRNFSNKYNKAKMMHRLEIVNEERFLLV